MEQRNNSVRSEIMKTRDTSVETLGLVIISNPVSIYIYISLFGIKKLCFMSKLSALLG